MPEFPLSPNLEQLRKQAKDLLRALRAADPPSHRRALAAGLRLGTDRRSDSRPGSHGGAWQLADALLIIAREHGCPSWPRLKVRAAELAQAAAQQRNDLPPTLPSPTASPCRQMAQALASEVTVLAKRPDAGAVAGRFALMPLRDILAVREFIV